MKNLLAAGDDDNNIRVDEVNNQLRLMINLNFITSTIFFLFVFQARFVCFLFAISQKSDIIFEVSKLKRRVGDAFTYLVREDRK